MRQLFLVLAVLFSCVAKAQTVSDDLSRHDFFYAGESKQMRMFIVRGGEVTWSYYNHSDKGEISDAVLMTDGNILIAHQFGIGEVKPDKSFLWHYDAPKGTEIHTIQPIGNDYVLFVQNGRPAKVVIMKIPECRVVHEFEVPASSGIHGQFRNARLSSRGTLLLAHMGMGYVAEYSVQGRELARWDVPGAWSVSEVGKENLLVVGRGGAVKEISRNGKTVWELNNPQLSLTHAQKAVRLRNGNTIVNNWWNEWGKEPLDTLHSPLQAVEVDKDGNVVWMLNSWKTPDLGPSTTITPLEQVVDRRRLFFGDYNGRQPKMMSPENTPMGEGKGIIPGRVAWIHSPGVATWDSKTGLWVEERWNSQMKADEMVKKAVVTVTGETNVRKAWKALFTDFNTTRKRGKRGYRKGESIAIKLNINNAITHHDTIELNSSPYVTLALVRSLVHDAKVQEQDIIICEPSRAITDSIYNRIHREFPGVRMVDNLGGDGREKCEYYSDQIEYSVDNGRMARGIAKCIVDATYLINSALLKTHSGPGVTLTGKNWYGATDINLLWRRNAHNGVSQDKRNGKPAYKTFVDWIAHKDLGQKCLLYLIDGTYGSRDVNGKPFPKWQKAPFNGDWACSLIASQDPLACDAVGMDLLKNEWPEFGSLNYCDEYLVEAASIPFSPSGTIYKQDGKPLTAPLGLFERCNKEGKYTKLDLRYIRIE